MQYLCHLGSTGRAESYHAGYRGRRPACPTEKRHGEDVVDKPGWICCGEDGGDGPPSITFHVNAPRGNVRVGFLRSYAGNMGRALLVVRAARSSDGKPLGRLTAAGRKQQQAAQRTLAGARRGKGDAAAGGARVLDGHWEQRVSLTELAEVRGVGSGVLAVSVVSLDKKKFKLVEVAAC